MADKTYEARVLEEPEAQDDQENIWMRGLWMIVLAIMFGFGEFVLGLAAIFQFLWMLFAGEKNENVVRFGEELSDWLARIGRFQTGASDEKPFPFMRWGIEES